MAAGLVVVASAAVSVAAEPASWPRWRGHEGAGQGGELSCPHGWGDSDWAWKVPLPGTGHASPIVAQGNVFTASADEASGKRFICCHATADGALVWQREIPGPIEPHHAQNSSASGSVAAGDHGVYWLWATRDGLRAEALSFDGEPLWHADLGTYECEHGFGSSAAVWRDLVIVPIDQDGPSAIVALDGRTGRERWRIPRESGRTAYSTPLVIDPGDDDTPAIAILASAAHGLTGIDPATGRVLWERRCFPRRTVSSPILAGPLVVGTCGEGGGDNLLVALKLPSEADRHGTTPLEPEIAYTLDRSVAPYVPTPVHSRTGSGQRLYLWGDRGVVTCVKADDGSILWRERAGGTFSASPIVVGHTVINVSADGEIVVMADADTPEVLGRVDLGEASRSTPAVADGRIFFRGQRHLFALRARAHSG